MEFGGGGGMAGYGFGSGVETDDAADGVASAADALGVLDVRGSAVGLHAASSNTGSRSAIDRARAWNRAEPLRCIGPFAELLMLTRSTGWLFGKLRLACGSGASVARRRGLRE